MVLSVTDLTWYSVMDGWSYLWWFVISFYFELASDWELVVEVLFAWSPSCLVVTDSWVLCGFLASYVLIFGETSNGFKQMNLVFIELLYPGCSPLCFTSEECWVVRLVCSSSVVPPLASFILSWAYRCVYCYSRSVYTVIQC